MFCNKCGQENNDSAAFCNKCGSSLQNVAFVNEVVKTSNKGNKIRIGAIIALIGAIIGALFSFLFCLDNWATGRVAMLFLFVVLSIGGVLVIINIPKNIAKIVAVLGVVFCIITAFLVMIVSLGGIIQLFSLDISVTFFYVPMLTISMVLLFMGYIKILVSVFNQKR